MGSIIQNMAGNRHAIWTVNDVSKPLKFFLEHCTNLKGALMYTMYSQWCPREIPLGKTLKGVYRGLTGLSKAPERTPQTLVNPLSGVFSRGLSLGHHWQTIVAQCSKKTFRGFEICSTKQMIYYLSVQYWKKIEYRRRNERRRWWRIWRRQKRRGWRSCRT